MRITLSLILLAISATAASNNNRDFFDRIEGVWAVKIPNSDVCSDKKFMHTISVSPDKKYINFTNHKAIIDVNLGEVKNLVYKVIYSENDSAILFLEGENRRIPTGDLILWQLKMEGQNYRWRIYGTPAGLYNNVIGTPCN